MRYSREPAHQHAAVPRVGILLVNLGTPDAPTAPAVRAYLRQFLSDPRVVEIPRAAWWLVLNGLVLTTRPRQSAKKYASIWMGEGSPLAVHTERQTKLLRGYLGERLGAQVSVESAMRYGERSIAGALQALRAAGCDRLLFLPLYPQYAAATTGSACDALFSALLRERNLPGLRIVKHFHDHAAYIRALAQSVRDHWSVNGQPDRVLMSFHGLPQFALERGDPYHCECQKTARLLAEALDLAPAQYLVTFQSRFGRARWLKPYTIETVVALGRARTPRIDVICPGFVADCLETLEEIALENKAAFLQAGGREFHYIASLNERQDWIRALAEIALDHLGGWIDPDFDLAAAERNASSRAARARALGAKA
jgi:ferrochelatase